VHATGRGAVGPGGGTRPEAGERVPAAPGACQGPSEARTGHLRGPPPRARGRPQRPALGCQSVSPVIASVGVAWVALRRNGGGRVRLTASGGLPAPIFHPVAHTPAASPRGSGAACRRGRLAPRRPRELPGPGDTPRSHFLDRFEHVGVRNILAVCIERFNRRGVLVGLPRPDVTDLGRQRPPVPLVDRIEHPKPTPAVQGVLHEGRGPRAVQHRRRLQGPAKPRRHPLVLPTRKIQPPRAAHPMDPPPVPRVALGRAPSPGSTRPSRLADGVAAFGSAGP
jgi:hypothetical protein